MIDIQEVQDLISNINLLDDDGGIDRRSSDDDSKFLKDATVDLMIFTRQNLSNVELVSKLIPKKYTNSSNIVCLLKSYFIIIKLSSSSKLNSPFVNKKWTSFINSQLSTTPQNINHQQICDNISLYALALSHCCALISQIYGERFKYIQTVLTKYLFSDSTECSLFASDIYMFITRLINPIHLSNISQFVFNICKFAPSKKVVMGAALVDRMLKQMDEKTRKTFIYRNRYPECLLHYMRDQ